jgi:hypothetical protein
LTNVSRQPKNLFLAISDVLKRNYDDLALVTIKKFFVENGKGIDPMLGYFVQVREQPGNTKPGRISVPLTSCLSGLD